MNINFFQTDAIENFKPTTEFEEKVLQFLREWNSDSQTVSVQTSGSTGTPKVFAIEKEKMRNSANMTCDFLNLKEGDTALLCLPVEYISGKMMTVRSLERKLNLFSTTPSVTPLETFNQNIDFCAMSPLQVENSLEKIHLIKNLIIGGAQVSETLKNKIFDSLRHKNGSNKIYETYGMSETLSHIALKQIYPVPENYFTAFKNVELSLDHRGCLKIYAPQLNPEILQTNDLVELKNEKQFQFLGRFDNVINSGGLKIYPEQLEGIVKKNISNELAFFGIKNETYGEKLVLVIEGENNEETQRCLNLAFSQIEAQFSKKHKPKDVIFIQNFPRLPNGKLNRISLSNLIRK